LDRKQYEIIYYCARGGGNSLILVRIRFVQVYLYLLAVLTFVLKDNRGAHATHRKGFLLLVFAISRPPPQIAVLRERREYLKRMY